MPVTRMCTDGGTVAEVLLNNCGTVAMTLRGGAEEARVTAA